MRIERQGVQSAEYDVATQTLQVQFARGAGYEYYAVPQAVFDWLCRCAEPGGYVRRMLTPRYRYRAVPMAEVTPEQDLADVLQASIERLERAAAVRRDEPRVSDTPASS
jgi:hypothetical protein